MAEVKWIKITTDIFDDEKIQMIDAMPEADAIEVIWFKLLVFAGKSNNNGVFIFNNRIAYTDEMLSSVFHRSLNVVRLAMETFINFGMIEKIDNVYSIPNWNKIQSSDSFEKIKQQNRDRQARFKEKQRKMVEEKKGNVTDNVKVTSSCSYSYSLSISNIISYLNNILNTNYKCNSKNTIKNISARLKEGYIEDDFYKVIDDRYKKWHDDVKMKEYLRPDTLFGTKFESYLNAAKTNDVANNSVHNDTEEYWQ